MYDSRICLKSIKKIFVFFETMDGTYCATCTKTGFYLFEPKLVAGAIEYVGTMFVTVGALRNVASASPPFVANFVINFKNFFQSVSRLLTDN